MKKYYLEEVAEIYSGATPSTKNLSFYEGGGISWITPKDLSGYRHKYVYAGQRSITDAGLTSCAARLLPKGTVLFSSRAPIGYVAIAGQELCTNQGFKNFVCKKELLLNEYLYYYLLQNRKKIEALGNGSTFKEVSAKTLAKYEINLPTLAEQEKIVNELVVLDEKYEENCGIICNIELLMEHLYSYFFEDASRVYDKMYLADVINIITGGTPSTKNEAYWNHGEYLWYTPTDITTCDNMVTLHSKKMISISGLENSGAKLIPAKTVLMTSRATIGEAVINLAEATTNQGILSLIPKKESIDALQIYFWVKHHKKFLSSIANGSTFKEIYKKDMEKLTINISHEASAGFVRQAKILFSYLESLVRENMIISELKVRLMETKFES